MARLITDPKKVRAIIIEHYRKYPGVGIVWSNYGVDYRWGNSEWSLMIREGILVWGYQGYLSRVCLAGDEGK